VVTCAKTAEPIDLPFELWTRVGRRKHKFDRIHQVAPMCPHMWAHWCHLANMIEPSICSSNAVLCQITLTTCLILFPHHYYHCFNGHVSLLLLYYTVSLSFSKILLLIGHIAPIRM